MTLPRLLAIVLAFALFPAVAQAHTTIIEPVESHFPYQQWVDEAKMPTPDVTLTLVFSACPDAPEVPACTENGAFTIWDSASDRRTFLHEVGHNFDYYMLPEWARQRFERLINYDGPPGWTADPNGPNERFAEAWASCAEKGAHWVGDPELAIRGRGMGGLRNAPFRRICRMLVAVGTPG